MSVNSQELLENLLTGGHLTANDLDELITARVQEDLYLDYKHGNELLDRKKANTTLRQYLSGFANSAGGVLIIGLDENTWTITGAKAPGGGDLAEWAARSITPIAPYFSPPPRFQVVKHPLGEVLVASVARSIGLVPSPESGETAFYFRFHDQTLNNKTLRAPDYLISDLVLGRREKPFLQVADFHLKGPGVAVRQEHTILHIGFSINLLIENHSLATASSVRTGLLCWATEEVGHHIRFSNYLRSYAEISDVDTNLYPGDRKLIHFTRTLGEIEPFETKLVSDYWQIHIPRKRFDTWYDYNWKATLYVMSRETIPIWFQIRVVMQQ